MHSVARRGPDVAVTIEAKTVRDPLIDLVEISAFHQPAPIPGDLEHPDAAIGTVIEDQTGFGNVKQVFVR